MSPRESEASRLRREYDPDRIFGDRLLEIEIRLHDLKRQRRNDEYIHELYNLRDAISNYETELEEAEYRFVQDNSEYIRTNAEKDAQAKVEEITTYTLMNQLQRALSINDEYNHPLFRSRLEEAVRMPGTIYVDVVNGRLVVSINLDLTAGKLEDWARAVKKTRQQKNMGKSREPVKSFMWAEKFYKVAREGARYIKKRVKRSGNKTEVTEEDLTEHQIEMYWDTMKSRLDNCSSLAPFWSIIDKGVAGFNSKTGGTAYPVATRTNFVEKTKRELQKKYQEFFSTAYKNAVREFERIKRLYKYRRDCAVKIYHEIDALIERYNKSKPKRKTDFYSVDYWDEPSSTTPTWNEPVVPDVSNEMSFLKSILGEAKFARADQDRLEELALKMQRGEEIPERMYLGKGVSKRTIQMLRKYRGL